MKRSVVAAIVVSVLVLAAPAGAAPAQPYAKLSSGIYACVLYDSGSGMLETKYNLRIKGKGKYEYARFADGNGLTDPKVGTYSSTKKKIVFKTGPMKSRYGKLQKTGTTPTISIYTKKPDKDTFTDCYKQ